MTFASTPQRECSQAKLCEDGWDQKFQPILNTLNTAKSCSQQAQLRPCLTVLHMGTASHVNSHPTMPFEPVYASQVWIVNAGLQGAAQQQLTHFSTLTCCSAMVSLT